MPTESQAKLISAIARARAAKDDRAVTLLTNKLSQGRPRDEVQKEYSDAPWYEKVPQATLDIARQFTEGATAGHLSEASAGIGHVFGQDYDTEKALEDARLADSRSRAPVAGAVAEGLGSVAPAKAIFGAVKGGLGPLTHIADEVPYLGKVTKPIADRLAAVGAGTTAGGVVGGATAEGKGTSIPEGIAVGMLGGGKGGALGGASPIVAPGAIATAIQALLAMKPSR